MHVVLFSQRKEYNKEEEYLESICSQKNLQTLNITLKMATHFPSFIEEYPPCFLGFKSRHSCILYIWNREESLSTDHRESFEENWNCLSTDRASNWNFESTEF